MRAVVPGAHAGPVTYGELLGRGIDNPGQAVYELELEREGFTQAVAVCAVLLPAGLNAERE
jgi:hypothetical protein